MMSVSSISIHTAPSAPPRAVNVSTEESCIVVSWMPPNLIHQNGPIITYVVKYGESDARSIKIRHYVEVEPQRSLNPKEKFTYRIESTETSLKMDVVYLVQVAAETDVGVGPFSDSIPVKLQGTYACTYVCTRVPHACCKWLYACTCMYPD